MEERRLLLAIALSLVVLMGYQLIFPPPQPAEPPRLPSEPAPVAEAVANTLPAPAESIVPELVAADTEAAIATVGDILERRIEVRGEALDAAFTNRGARLLSWKLNGYLDGEGHPEEMVQTFLGGPLPLDIETGDDALDERLRAALFVASREAIDIGGPDGGTLVFRFAEGDVQATKTLEFEPPGFLVSVTASVSRAGGELPVSVFWGPGVGNASPAEREVQGYRPPRFAFLREDSVTQIDVDDVEVGEQRLDGFSWLGVESTYFAALFVPGGPPEASLRALALPEELNDELGPQVGIALDGAPARLYVGPKDYFVLEALPDDLVRIVPVGEWIGPVVVPLMRLLRFVHGHIGNYGWSIVVLTIMINLVMAPFRHMSIANSMKMAKLAPEMKVIQDRYRKVPALDPKRQQMQKEVQSLYAKHGMSMGSQLAVGCLPLLLTMPFLIAFYRVLQTFIDLRGASFLWIPDLSLKDPLFLTPILMGASMYAMQRLTPTTLDPAQQRMMTLMPVVLLAMFLWAPAGLNLYWLAANICSLVQQGVTMQLLRSREAASAPQKKKRRK